MLLSENAKFSPWCEVFHSCFPVNDTLDDIMNESGDEEEGDAIVNQVLDEIGIEISGKVSSQLIYRIVMTLFLILSKLNTLNSFCIYGEHSGTFILNLFENSL